MLFNSQAFILGFLPCVLGLYYLAAERVVLRQAVMVAASLAFYGWWDMRFVPVLVGLTLAKLAAGARLWPMAAGWAGWSPAWR